MYVAWIYDIYTQSPYYLHQSLVYFGFLKLIIYSIFTRNSFHSHCPIPLPWLQSSFHRVVYQLGCFAHNISMNGLHCLLIFSRFFLIPYESTWIPGPVACTHKQRNEHQRRKWRGFNTPPLTPFQPPPPRPPPPPRIPSLFFSSPSPFSSFVIF